MNSINVDIELLEEDFGFLKEYKKEMGLTWEGLLKAGTPFQEWKNQQYIDRE